MNFETPSNSTIPDWTPAPPTVTAVESPVVEVPVSPEEPIVAEESSALVGQGVGWKSSTVWGSLVGILVVVALLLAGLWWRTSAPKSLSATELFTLAMTNARSLQSYQSTFSVVAEIRTPSNGDGGSVTLKGSNVVDQSDRSATKELLAFTLLVDVKNGTAPAALSSLGNAELAMDILSVKPQESFLRFRQLPVVTSVTFPNITNQWIRMAADDASALSASALNDSAKLSEAFNAFWYGAQLFGPIQELAVDGSLRHLKTVIAPDHLYASIKSLSQKLNIPMDSAQEGELKAIIIERIGTIPVELWVNEKDHQIYRWLAKVRYADDIVQLDVVYQSDLGQLNQPVKIDVPTGAKAFNEVMKEVMGALTTPTAILPPPVTPPTTQAPDSDFDGQTDQEESLLGTNPYQSDTDVDGLIDGEEVKKYHTDPLKVDTDGDGLSDGEEVFRWKTDPTNRDTDVDGYTDGQEVKNGYNPAGAGKLK